MKEDLFVLSGSGLQYAGSRSVEPYDRDPGRVWIGSSQWYLDLSNFTLIHHGEGLQTLYTADPSVLLYTNLATFGEKTPEGRILKSPTAAWFEISNQLVTNPDFRFEFCAHSEKFEHFLAASYCIEGWPSVTVTPRSGDRGRDVIAQWNAERVLHEAKAYNVKRVVKAEQVRALYGVWSLDDAASKAVITTTADFAPGIEEEFKEAIPQDLQIVNGAQFVDGVSNVTTTQSAVLISGKLFEAAGVPFKLSGCGRNVPQRSVLSREEVCDSSLL